MKTCTAIFSNILLFSITLMAEEKKTIPNNYKALESLFVEWRSFENPPLLDGAPDYRQSRFNSYQKDSVNFKNLPFELYEIKRFENDTVIIDKHESSSITALAS